MYNVYNYGSSKAGISLKWRQYPRESWDEQYRFLNPRLTQCPIILLASNDDANTKAKAPLLYTMYDHTVELSIGEGAKSKVML